MKTIKLTYGDYGYKVDKPGDQSGDYVDKSTFDRVLALARSMADQLFVYDNYFLNFHVKNKITERFNEIEAEINPDS